MTNGRLLWVDDEIDLLKGHIMFLQNKGYEVATCSNGTDAVELCRNRAFDLILLDENMPGLSGLETLAGIKDISPNVPVVMVTKNEAEDLMDQAIGSKIADYLLKPVNPKQILLTLKKNIHRHEIQQEAVQTGYRREFGRIGVQMSENLSAGEWTELYKRLVHWELELDGADSAMGEMLRMQKEEANLTFAKFIRRNYERWMSHPEERPMMSPDVFKREVFPRLAAGKKVFLLILDNLRFDQWRVLGTELAEQFDIDERLYFSILPTSTQYARNAIFAGLMPGKIREMYPDLWVDEEEDEGKNLCEEALIRHQLDRYRRREQFTYHKINDSVAADKLLSNFSPLTKSPLNILVINFIDILSHARTESRMVRELAGGEAAYRSITLSWFRHTPIKDLFSALASLDYEIIITTDHGSIRATAPVKVVGDRNVNTNLRYKLGRNLSYNPKEVFEIRHPQRFGLPAPNLSTTYIFAQGDKFFAYPNNYNYYVSYYKDTFQHGGVSLEEMIIPLVTLRPKKR
ncbi:alginate biosynthesis transcriptional regulatory protein AlgB [Bacteroidaceae bacterium]|uniref:T9SS response regulator signal transducer PorX n=1 Tax=Prevotella sp. MGM2 TaxID=2033406 RepID=UPI000CE9F142|nr:bifunctional response regulator/alkaline phosphatase family protein [Prevotella sp. MGM2]GAY30107.1 two-component response regulator [Prevotella sp. MGM2]GFI35622.1 alginate biosynthesis transcriptional regulatory protein AlgB [Bacteroidaceae bacterium]